jgi:hypothetical protein
LNKFQNLGNNKDEMKKLYKDFCEFTDRLKNQQGYVNLLIELSPKLLESSVRYGANIAMWANKVETRYKEFFNIMAKVQQTHGLMHISSGVGAGAGSSNNFSTSVSNLLQSSSSSSSSPLLLSSNSSLNATSINNSSTSAATSTTTLNSTLISDAKQTKLNANNTNGSSILINNESTTVSAVVIIEFLYY